LIAHPAQRPNESDFSGEWILIKSTPPTADAARSLTVRQPIVRTSASGAPMRPFFSHLVVERHYAMGVQSQTFMIGVEGGTVSGVPSATQVETRESARWADSGLVIVTSRWSWPAGELRQDSEHKEVWQLDGQGILVVTLTDQEAGEESRTTMLTYRRR
jgi:hypothetical protein